MAVLLALAAAVVFALGTVLQQQVAEQSSDDDALRAGFLLQLARRPRWLAGIAADGAGFVFQFLALQAGRLVVVQPVIATSVVFALPFGAWLGGARPGRRELGAAVAVTVGLIAFLIVSDPRGGRSDPTTLAWICSGGACAAASGLLVLAARGRPPGQRAALIGIATGILFGLSALLTKAVGEQLDKGIVDVVADWHLYALIVVGWASMTLSQASLQSGALGAAIATQMAVDPLTSVLLGIFALGERLHETALGAAGSVLALLVMIGGVIVLAGNEQDAPPPAQGAPRGVGPEPALS
ncbi:MAG: hypothetical protein JWQ48_3022 [Conexibacter sp.]|nr:hypothetical protein [Conexibacter sp.]